CGLNASAKEPPTFAKDIARIVYERCAPCHQRDGDAPFSLVSYDEVRRRARLIVEVTARRYMPPWKPDGESPAFDGDRRLTNEQIAVIDRRSEEHTSELQSRFDLVCRLLLEKKKKRIDIRVSPMIILSSLVFLSVINASFMS